MYPFPSCTDWERFFFHGDDGFGFAKLARDLPKLRQKYEDMIRRGQDEESPEATSFLKATIDEIELYLEDALQRDSIRAFEISLAHIADKLS